MHITGVWCAIIPSLRPEQVGLPWECNLHCFLGAGHEWYCRNAYVCLPSQIWPLSNKYSGRGAPKMMPSAGITQLERFAKVNLRYQRTRLQATIETACYWSWSPQSFHLLYNNLSQFWHPRTKLYSTTGSNIQCIMITSGMPSGCAL